MPDEILINRSSILPPSQATGPAAGEVLPGIAAGQEIQAQVVSQLTADTYVLSILGRAIVAQAQTQMAPGDLLTLAVTSLNKDILLKLVALQPGPPAAGAAVPPVAPPHPQAQKAMAVLQDFRLEASARTVQLAASFAQYGIPITREALAQTTVVLEQTPGNAALNVEAAAYLISKGIPITPQAIGAAADLIYEPAGGAAAVEQLASAADSLARSDTPLNQQTSESLIRLLDSLAPRLSDPGVAAAPPNVAQTARQLEQARSQVQDTTAQLLAGNGRLVRVDAALRLAEEALAQDTKEPRGTPVRLATTAALSQQVAQRLEQSTSDPLITRDQLASLSKTETASLVNRLMEIERREMEQNPDLRALRDAHAALGRMIDRTDVVRLLNASTAQADIVTTVAEVPLQLLGGPAAAALKMYYRKGGKRKSKDKSHAVLSVTLPHLGLLRADATLQGQDATVRFTTRRKEVAEAIEAERDQLSANLERIGFSSQIAVILDRVAEEQSPLLDGLRLGSPTPSTIDTRG